MGWLSALRNFLRPSPRTDPEKRTVDLEVATDPKLVRNADWRDVLNIAALLDKHQVDYVLVGGYALNFNGLVRQTADVDILVSTDSSNNARWIAALSELPDGAAAELASVSSDPFPKDEWDEDPGVIRIADVILVDVMPKACGLTISDLRLHVHRVYHMGVPINVLDLQGLRKTKQGVRPKDVIDLQHIDMTLEAFGENHAPSNAGMSRRKLAHEPVPVTDRISFVAPPSPSDIEIAAARSLIDAVRNAGGTVDVEVDTILATCDLARIQALEAYAGDIPDLSGVLDGSKPDPVPPASSFRS